MWQLTTWNNDQEAPARGDGVVEVYRYCAVVGGLLGWTQYLVGVRAWAGLEISVAATPVKTATMSDCEYKYSASVNVSSL